MRFLLVLKKTDDNDQNSFSLMLQKLLDIIHGGNDDQDEMDIYYDI